MPLFPAFKGAEVGLCILLVQDASESLFKITIMPKWPMLRWPALVPYSAMCFLDKELVLGMHICLNNRDRLVFLECKIYPLSLLIIVTIIYQECSMYQT